MVISIDAEKAFDKSQHTFNVTATKTLGIEESYLNINRLYTQTHSHHHAEWGKIERDKDVHSDFSYSI
jgi:hypothetical protein